MQQVWTSYDIYEENIYIKHYLSLTYWKHRKYLPDIRLQYFQSVILSKMLLGKTRHQSNLRLGDASKTPHQYRFYSVNPVDVIDTKYHLIWYCP